MPASKFRTAAVTLAAIAATATATAVDANAAMRTGATATSVQPVVTASRISAAPTNESSKEQRQKCAQWSSRLQAAEGFTLQVDGHQSTPQPNPAVEEAANAAMDDGCFVIY